MEGLTPSVPRDRVDDYTEQMAAQRRRFVADATGVDLRHVGAYSLDPGSLPGNIENFTGVAQVPIGLAGPLRINGEHARGDFYVPLATTEGTLVASYNRGMRLLTAAGGVRATVVDDRMQRAPVFVLDDALAAREFGAWVHEHHKQITAAAEFTTRIGKLLEIEQYAVGPLRYLRFDYSTGDAAGQNMALARDPGRVRVDPGDPPRPSPVRALRCDRHGQEALPDQHAAHPRQAGRGRGHAAG